MTNGDKYLKDGVDVEELAAKIIEYGVFGDTATWKQAIIEFMNKQVKPTLTEDEKVILRNVDKEMTMIRRCVNGDLDVFDNEGIFLYLHIFNHLFQFIKPRRRI